jgi:non-specific serine/threonine protein kinase
MRDRQERVDGIAEAISDGTPVDWERAYASAAGRERVLDQFRVIEGMSALRRSDLESTEPPQTATDRVGSAGDDTSAVPGATMASDGAGTPDRIGHYVIEGVLGQGGMGIVYLAYDSRLDRRVAIKGLPEDLVGDRERMRRFQREAKLIASMNHPHIATVHGLEESGRGRYLVMERVAGRTLSQFLRHERMNLNEVIRVCTAVAQALEAAHEQGVIHRDLKPGNVMLGPRGIVKVLDFGLARRTETMPPAEATEAPTVSRMTDSLDRLGTPGYMSPEQIMGLPLGERSDTFAFGCLLFECLTGARAFEGVLAAQLVAATLLGEPDWQTLPAGTPRELRALLKRCLEKDLLRRGSMTDVRQVLERIAARRASRRIIATVEPTALATEGPRQLPGETSSFVGRELEMTECIDALAESRLLTLTGIGGCGKTRLAIRIGAELAGEYPGGVYFVDLAQLADPDQVTAAVAGTIDVHEQPERPLISTIIEALLRRPTLLILDNCEHLIEACANVVRPLLRETSVRILATSREPLGTAGERIYVVPPLSVPRGDGPHVVLDLAGYDSVQLFVERARQVVPGLPFDESNAAVIARLCVRLDGIPLALELAAARTRVLSLREISARLDESFRLLSDPGGGVPARHQKLQAVIAWSYEHLSEEERRLLRALSVFAGGAPLAAVTAVAGSTDELEVLDLLTHLAEKSMVVVERDSGKESRYRLLETVRQYARDRLDEAGESDAIHDRHLDYFYTLVETAFSSLAGTDEATWVARLERDQANIHAALAWCDHSSDSSVRALRMTSRLGRFWYVRGDLTLGGRELATALNRQGANKPIPERAGALYSAGDLAVFRGDFMSARVHLEEAHAIYLSLGDDWGVMRSLFGLANAHAESDDYPEARARYQASLELARKLGFRRGEALILGNLGEIAGRQADLQSAIALTTQARTVLLGGSDRHGLAMASTNLAGFLIRSGEFKTGRLRLSEGLGIFRELGAKRGAVYGMQFAADLALGQGDAEHAARFLSGSIMLRDTIGMAHSESEDHEVAARRERAREALGEDGFARAWATGQSAQASGLIDEVMAWLESSISEGTT